MKNYLLAMFILIFLTGCFQQKIKPPVVIENNITVENNVSLIVLEEVARQSKGIL